MKGKWITHPLYAKLKPLNVFHKQLDNNFSYSHPEDMKNIHTLFLKKFTLDGFSRVMIKITADDLFKLYVNGNFVLSGPVPGYYFSQYYNTVDVTEYLRKGVNTVAVHTYYYGVLNRVTVSGDMRTGLWLELEADGKTALVSDESFLCAPHSGYLKADVTGYNTQFKENYDFSSPENGFMKENYSAENWFHAEQSKYADYTLVPAPVQNLTYYEEKPVSVRRRGDSVLFDFGCERVGYPEFTVSGRKGSKVTVVAGEEFDDDGNIKNPLRCGCDYGDTLTLSGGKDKYEAFDYKAFRYLEITTEKGANLDEGSVRMRVRHYPFKEFRRYEGADKRAKQVWELCRNTLKYGVQEVYMDCPTREKGQYFQDGWTISVAHSLLTGDTAMMRKMLQNQAATSFICPGLTAQGPCAHMQEIADASLLFPRILADYYGLSKDADTVRKLLPFVDKMLDYFHGFSRTDGLIGNLDKWNVMDWPPQLRDGYDFRLEENTICTGFHNVINAYYIGAIKARNYCAAVAGKPALPVKELEKAFINAFYDQERALFIDSETTTHSALHSNVFPLFFGIGGDKRLRQNTLDLIREKRLACCNIFGSFPLLALLKRWKEEELMKELILSDEAMGRMLNEGATATMEAWGKDLKWNTALFHLTFSAMLIFFTDYEFPVY